MDKEIKLTKKIGQTISKQRAATNVKNAYDMVIFCHLRWDFVYQRPQHIISRLSKAYNILVVEEPILEGERNTYELVVIHPKLTILKPKVDAISEIKNIFEQMKLSQIEMAWFYSPAFVDLLPYLKLNTIIYDCMDELSQFKGASSKLRAQESFLIQEAQMVFTGGKSLYQAKLKQATNVHCFPSSVDVAHFKTATNSIAVPKDIAGIKGPIVGYIGVIDERIDLDLIENTALALSNVSFVIIGPIAKISDSELPRAENIYYLGMKNYKDLPGYLKAFDIAMMPFALNEATEFISPTKTLEYMAANKLIISTAITDVVRDYDHVVEIVDSSDDFIEAIISILTFKTRIPKSEYKTILEKTSWDATVQNMLTLIKQTTK